MWVVRDMSDFCRRCGAPLVPPTVVPRETGRPLSPADHDPSPGMVTVAGGVSLVSIGVMGTADDLADVKAEADKLGCRYYKVWDSFESWAAGPQQAADGGPVVDAESSFLTLQPTFTIHDLAKAEPFMRQCVEATRAEAGCIYYGWTISDDGTTLFCREAYVDGVAVNTHLLNAVPIVGAMLESGAVSLDKIELHGPRSEWAPCKEEADKLGIVYFDVDVSFAKFEMQEVDVEATRDPAPQAV